MPADPVLVADAVSVRLGGIEVVADVSLCLSAGEVVALVGESGSGKTTLCRALLGLLPVSAGKVSYLGRPLAAWPGRALRRGLQMLLQDAQASLSPRKTLGALLGEPIRIHRLPFRETWLSMQALLHRLALPPDLLAKYPHEISGGQARRVGIARALILAPQVLVADEPTAGLDVSVQGEVLNLLLDLQIERDMLLLLVSHDLTVVQRITRRTVVMYLGQVIEDAPTVALFATPAHPYTAALLAAQPSVQIRRVPTPLAGEIPNPASPPPGCRFHTRCPAAEATCRDTPPPLGLVGDNRLARCHFPFRAAQATLKVLTTP